MPKSRCVKRVLIVDDEPRFLQLLSAFMGDMGFEVATAGNGKAALSKAIEQPPDLILADVHMPEVGGLDLCRRIREQPRFHEVPVIMVTAASSEKEIAEGFRAGADDYITKPIRMLELEARVRSMMRISDAQAALRKANEQLHDLNTNLENKVRDQVRELERVNRLRRFFSPQIVRTILSDSAHDRLREHSGEVTVVFLDLRRFSPFAEREPPEVVIQTIRQFHRVVGPIIFEHRGTLERFTGDGVMVFLGDPEPMPEHPLEALRMSLDLQRAFRALRAEWSSGGYDLELGIGVATGIASLGLIGFDERMDYAAIGVVTNLAARICAQAADGQILLSRSVRDRVGDALPLHFRGEFMLKGFSSAQEIFEVNGPAEGPRA